jgi:hypothetical protein
MAIETSVYSGGMRTTTYDSKNIFILNNETEIGRINNEDYDDITYPAGTVMGRIATTNMLTPITSEASDGSQFPIGVLHTETTVPAGETVNATIVISGHVDASLLILQGSDTLNTVVSLRTIRDRIKSDSAGIILKPVKDLGPTL